MADQYVMANANRCTVYPKHVMVNRGRSEMHFGDIYSCDCGEACIGNSDESQARGYGYAVYRAKLEEAAVSVPPARKETT